MGTVSKFRRHNPITDVKTIRGAAPKEREMPLSKTCVLGRIILGLGLFVCFVLMLPRRAYVVAASHYPTRRTLTSPRWLHSLQRVQIRAPYGEF